MPVKNITEFKIFFTLWNEYKMNERETDEVGGKKMDDQILNKKTSCGIHFEITNYSEMR